MMTEEEILAALRRMVPIREALIRATEGDLACSLEAPAQAIVGDQAEASVEATSGPKRRRRDRQPAPSRTKVRRARRRDSIE